MIRNRYPTKKNIMVFLKYNGLFALEQVINEAMDELDLKENVIIEETGYTPTYFKEDNQVVRELK